MRPTRSAFWLTTAALLVLIAGTELPTPLYVDYQRRIGFADSTLTLVFAIYAFALIPMLVVFGRVADRIGRLPVLVAGVVVAAAGAVVLAEADSTAWLLVGRAVQGVAVGIATGAATAALTELADTSHNAALWATVAVAGGGATGPLLAGLLAQYAPWPSALSYLVQVGAIALLLAGFAITRSAYGRPHGAKPASLPGVPAGIRRPFARVGLVVFAVWAVGGLYTAVVPAYVSRLLGTSNLALLGAVPFAMLATAAATQLTLRSVPARRAQLAGLVAVTAGLAALVAAFPTHSLALVAGSAVLDGVGLGLGFLGAQSDLTGLAPAERRAEVSGAFNVCLYLGVSLPVLGAGFVADATSLFIAVVAFSVLIAVLAAVGAHLTIHDRLPPAPASLAS